LSTVLCKGAVSFQAISYFALFDRLLLAVGTVGNLMLQLHFFPNASFSPLLREAGVQVDW